jgi:hypothetical protein
MINEQGTVESSEMYMDTDIPLIPLHEYVMYIFHQPRILILPTSSFLHMDHTKSRLIIYLFNSSALFFKSSLLSGVGKLSAWTGPCLVISCHLRLLSHPNDEYRTGFALWALAWRPPPLVALLASSESWSGCDEAVLSEDSLATLSVMPVAKKVC